MKFALSPEGLSDLENFCRKNLFLGFDYDGTLAPYPKDPTALPMAKEVLEAFRELAEIFPTCVVTGRSSTSLAGFLPSSICVIGNHGGEALKLSSESKNKVEAKVSEWTSTLTRALPSADYFIENKGLSLTLHYPAELAPEELNLSVTKVLKELSSGARLIPGKYVVNVVPHELPNKGDAVLFEMKANGSNALFFAGDDVTDEDAFGLAGIEMFSVRVGKTQNTKAKYYLDGQFQMKELLQHMVKFCRR